MKLKILMGLGLALALTMVLAINGCSKSSDSTDDTTPTFALHTSTSAS